MDGRSLRVAVRYRPLNVKENADAGAVHISANTISCSSPTHGEHCFSFEHGMLFGPNSSQGDVWEAIGRPVLENAIEGFNSTIFAYGATGSGKTWSMNGRPNKIEDSYGIIPRMCRQLFLRIDDEISRKSTVKFLVTVSYFDLCHEMLHDRFDNPHGLKDAPKTDLGPRGLIVKEHVAMCVYVKGLKERVVDTSDQLLELLDNSVPNNVFPPSCTTTILTINVHQQDSTDTHGHVVAKIQLVKLAAPNRPERQHSIEKSSIDKSIHNLRTVMTVLSENATGTKGRRLVPYRDSKLTRLLQDALGGNAYSTMLVTLSPAASFQENLKILQFAELARGIVKNHAPVRNEEAVRISRLNENLREVRKRLLRLQQDSHIPAGPLNLSADKIDSTANAAGSSHETSRANVGAVISSDAVTGSSSIEAGSTTGTPLNASANSDTPNAASTTSSVAGSVATSSLDTNRTCSNTNSITNVRTRNQTEITSLQQRLVELEGLLAETWDTKRIVSQAHELAGYAWREFHHKHFLESLRSDVSILRAASRAKDVELLDKKQRWWQWIESANSAEITFSYLHHQLFRANNSTNIAAEAFSDKATSGSTTEATSDTISSPFTLEALDNLLHLYRTCQPQTHETQQPQQTPRIKATERLWVRLEVQMEGLVDLLDNLTQQQPIRFASVQDQIPPCPESMLVIMQQHVQRLQHDLQQLQTQIDRQTSPPCTWGQLLDRVQALLQQHQQHTKQLSPSFNTTNANTRTNASVAKTSHDEHVRDDIQLALELLQRQIQAQRQWQHHHRNDASSAPSSLPLLVSRLRSFVHQIDARTQIPSWQDVSTHQDNGFVIVEPRHIYAEGMEAVANTRESGNVVALWLQARDLLVSVIRAVDQVLSSAQEA